MAPLVSLESGSCVYSCLFTVVKDHRTLLLLVQATHRILAVSIASLSSFAFIVHRLVASLLLLHYIAW